jgi:Glutathione S-transferase, N-terminal domain
MSQLTSPVEIYWISGSPFAWRVLLTAEVKGIPYEGKLLEASKGELKTPEFLAINPLGRVPAIRDGNFTLHVSSPGHPEGKRHRSARRKRSLVVGQGAPPGPRRRPITCI